MKKLICAVIICVLFIIPVTVKADKADKLIQLLIDKEIITADEAAFLVEELEEDVAKNNDQKNVKKFKDSPGWTEKFQAMYNKGAVIKTADENFSLKLNFRLHGMYNYLNPENSSSRSTFMVRRARILASGSVFYPWLRYSTQVTLEGSNAGMRDAYMETSYFSGFKPRFGQYKVPYDREFLNIGYNLQLIDRSVSSAVFSLQRDVGLQISGKGILNSFDYSVGIFNGSGANSVNVDNDYMYVGRLVWAPFGSYPYWESAVDQPSSPKFALGFAGAYMPGLEPGERETLAGRLGNTSVVPVESDVNQWTVDIAYKYNNFSLMSGYHYRSIDPKALTVFGKQQAWGMYLQSGFFIIPRQFEIAGRYAYVDPDNPVQINDNEITELTVGLNYFFQGHNLKTGISYSFFSTEKQDGDSEDHAFKASVIMQF